MKKTLSKIKLGLASFFMASISFLSKVFGQGWEDVGQRYYAQTAYGVANPKQSEFMILAAIKALQRLLVIIVLVIGIINLIKVRKIDDKIQKKEKIKKTIITIVVMLIIMLLLGIAARLLKEYRLSYR